jgi:hypothetical protein
MVASGKTPEAVKVAQNHARIVSGFLEKGPAPMHEKHARVLAGEAPKNHDTSDSSPTSPPHDHGASAANPSETVTPETAAETKAKTEECCKKPAGEAAAACCLKSTKEAKPGCCQAKKDGAKAAAPAPAQ